MDDTSRIRDLLEAALDAGRTPDEMYADQPRLLPAIRAEWGRLRRIEAEIDALFPGSSAADGTRSIAREGPSDESPRIPNHDILDRVGRGGMGVVYQARHRTLQRVVALKMVAGGACATATIGDAVCAGAVPGHADHQAAVVAEVRRPPIL